ncbi:MAG TPA: ABC transporter ATP-binding protein [Ktedonobacterales bacterium]|nr:ABC transporter ATP-binding protein [Ktedonobacterales bacterium]
MIRLFRFLQPFRLSIAVVLVLVFLQSLANLYLPTLMANIVDTGIVNGDTGYILRVGGVMLLITLGGTLCAVVSSYFAARTAVGFGRDVRARLFSHVEGFSLHEFDTFGTASMITRTTNDTNQVQQVLVIILTIMVGAPMMAIGGIIMALQQDTTLTWVLAAAIPVLVIAIILLMTKAIPLFRVMQLKLDKLNLILDEGLTGVRVIRAFDRDAYEQRRFEQANRDLTDTAITVNRIVAVLWPLMMLVLNVTTVAIVWFGSLRVDAGQMQVGSMIAFLQYAMQILFAFLMLSMMFIMLPRAAASATRINAVLDIASEIRDAPGARILAASEAEATVPAGTVEFEDVTFSYPGAEEPALSHISFRARPGQITAIIGGTGAGKSTLVNLIPRFYDVDSGRVLVDGTDVRELTQEALRAKLGFVPQQAVLFSGTVAENIRFGNPEASDEAVRRAAEIAQAADFIGEMGEGFNATIAQGGTNVSGGQKQRLSIARALARRPEIYIFDDTFSALDYATDARLRVALKRETRDATVLIVAQRVSTVMDADQILVLDEGRLVGVGTHRELMERSPVYREIVLSQLSAEEVA